MKSIQEQLSKNTSAIELNLSSDNTMDNTINDNQIGSRLERIEKDIAKANEELFNPLNLRNKQMTNVENQVVKNTEAIKANSENISIISKSNTEMENRQRQIAKDLVKHRDLMMRVNKSLSSNGNS